MKPYREALFSQDFLKLKMKRKFLISCRKYFNNPTSKFEVKIDPDLLLISIIVECRRNCA